MKKLVMLLALASAVISANAARVDWGVPATAEDLGTTVYLFASMPGDYADLAEFTAAAVSSATVISQSGRGGTTTYFVPKTTAEGASVTSSADFYFAIVAADEKSFNYVAASGLADYVYYPENQESSKGDFRAITTTTILAGDSKPIGIPEPTSSMLLVLGGAMLALRRRRT